MGPHYLRTVRKHPLRTTLDDMGQQAATAAATLSAHVIYSYRCVVIFVLAQRIGTLPASAERIGMRPVKNEARPAVQLAWRVPSPASLYGNQGSRCPFLSRL